MTAAQGHSFTGGIVDLVIFDAGIVALDVGTGPVEIHPQLQVVDLVLADHQMRGVDGANAAAAGIGAIEAHLKPFDPQPIAGVGIEGIVEGGDLPAMAGRIIQAADAELQVLASKNQPSLMATPLCPRPWFKPVMLS